MHHQRSACEATTSASIDQASAPGTSGRRTHASTSIADQQAGVQHDHERVVALPGLDAAALEAPGGVALGDDQLGEPLEADQARPGP